ncbi:MAG: sulfotransferase family protein [Chloroflexota bacterium]
MTLKVIGAGLGRTGTTSLKLALERLFGAPCYHMSDLFQHREHVPIWHQAALGQTPDWSALFAGCAAAVDWPASAFWRELTASYPEAVVVLSLRDSESWWQSANRTIFPKILQADGDWRLMMDALFDGRFTSSLKDKAACIAAYEQHIAEVRKSVPANRLVEWQASDGWESLCAALNVPIPDEPFPHKNTSQQFLSGRE